MNDLPAQGFDQRIILAFRVCDDNIVRCREEHVCHFTLCAERFTRTRRTQNQTVRIFELFAICHNHVVRHCIQTVIEGIALHEKFLRGERHEDGRGSCSQCPLDGDKVIGQRQAAHKSLLLHIVQSIQGAVELLSDTSRLKHCTVQLLFGFRSIEEQHRNKEHTLIAALQIIQNLLGFTTISCKVTRNNFHIIAGTHRLFLFLNLHAVKVCDLALDEFDCLELVYRLHMDADHQILVHVQKLCQNLIRQFRGKDVQIGYCADSISHLEVLAALEQKTGRSNEVLGSHAALQDAVIAELKLPFFLLMEHLVHDL